MKPQFQKLAKDKRLTLTSSKSTYESTAVSGKNISFDRNVCVCVCVRDCLIFIVGVTKTKLIYRDRNENVSQSNGGRARGGGTQRRSFHRSIQRDGREKGGGGGGQGGINRNSFPLTR